MLIPLLQDSADVIVGIVLHGLSSLHDVLDFLDRILLLVHPELNFLVIGFAEVNGVTATSMLTCPPKHKDLLLLLIEVHGTGPSGLRPEAILGNSCPLVCLEVVQHKVIEAGLGQLNLVPIEERLLLFKLESSIILTAIDQHVSAIIDDLS